jgi:hypothetical protein
MVLSLEQFEIIEDYIKNNPNSMVTTFKIWINAKNTEANGKKIKKKNTKDDFAVCSR